MQSPQNPLNKFELLRQRAERKLPESERYLKQIIDFLPDATMVIDTAGKVIAWNHAMERMTGVMARDMVGKGDYEYAIPFYGERRPILIDLVGNRDNAIEGNYRYVKQEGEAMVSEVYDCRARPGGTLWNRASLLYDEKGEVIGAIESIRDITDHKKAEADVKSQKAYLEGLVDNMPDAIATFDEDGTVTEINPQFTALFGYPVEEALGQNISELVGPPDRLEEAHAFRRAAVSGHALDVETVRRRKDGTLLDVSLRSAPIVVDNMQIGYLVIYRNISLRKRAEKERSELETQLLQARKMEAIGTLTGGIAHDYNNLLSIVMGNLSLAMEEVTSGSDLAVFLNGIDKASLKIRDLTHELMALSRGGIPVKKEASIKELMRIPADVIPLDSGISLKESIARDLWLVPYDSHKMGTVFRNVVINAVEAMPDGGTMSITARNLRVEEADTDPGLPLKPGAYVHISIADEGKGILGEHLGRVFDPYFSTKAMGVQKGMGLGLATSYAIVQKHGGHMAVRSSPGAGTVVNIYLPVENKQIGTDNRASRDEFTRPAKRVLVMDDDEMLRQLAEQMLKRLGYAVKTVKDGAEAVKVFKKEKDMDRPFDAVILDLTVKGGMGGEQTMGELFKIDPHVKAVLSSGYFNDPVMSDFKAYGFMGVLPKPYSKETLENVLKKMLE